MGVHVRNPRLMALGLVAVTGVVYAPTPTQPLWVERETAVMGTRLRVAVAARSRAHGIRAIQASFVEVRRLDAILSSWRPESELSRLNNAAPDHPVALSDELLNILVAALRWTSWTEGAFDPGIGALVDVWDLRGAGRRPSHEELTNARAAAGLRRFRFDPSAGTLARPSASSWIDAGGFGKGLALRNVERTLQTEGIELAFVDFGGQVLAMGRPPGERGWPVGVADPSARREAAVRLTLRDQSAATTSVSERFVLVGGQRMGHVLDPRTGAPVTSWGSVTVVARDPFVADLLATALFTMGPDEGAAWADTMPEIGVLVVRDHTDSLSLRWNSAMSAVLAGQSRVHISTHISGNP
jgi:thiamine biosynthesis lipoprotein